MQYATRFTASQIIGELGGQSSYEFFGEKIDQSTTKSLIRRIPGGQLRSRRSFQAANIQIR
ncbi:hypothetical protein ANCDUO_16010 [Ancylostoma duodenale]|uniref:Uncharacterized protein n=1 Tax=Ancylostoma duodenale TaxID=51022 RepID=A0A0C2G4J9_9BILA|nr:hypothetical protein ANCDUO_16010 [Ancylostoma duodenale]